MNIVKVKVVFRKAKGSYVLRWHCPETGAWKEKSARTATKKSADKMAAQLEGDLQQGRYIEPSNISWADFRIAFEGQKLPALAVKSQNSYKSALNHVERILRPDKLAELDGPAISRLQTKLRAEGGQESTIATHLRHIGAALRWANRLDMLVKMPTIEKPRRARKSRRMKGRPITGEEFDRMVAACDKVRPDDSPIWRKYLEGLWLSGLRLAESLALDWDGDAPMSLDFTGKYPCFRIVAEAEKGFRDRLLAITPDFAEYLDQTPPELRTGRVFKVADLGLRLDTVSKIVSKIGAKAGIVVNREQGKFASAHDLRRAFGNRWASKVMPAVLQQLMRHESIDTTMKYYVAQDASDIAGSLWKAYGVGDLSGDPEGSSGANEQPAEGRQ